MKYHKQFALTILSAFMCTLIVGCTASPEMPPQSEEVSTTITPITTRDIVSSTPLSAIPTQSLNPRPSPKIEPTEGLTITPDVLLTLSSEDPEALKQQMLLSNGDCQLPCWWGIIPGETDWQTVESFLSGFVTHIGAFEREDGKFVYNVKVLEPDDSRFHAWMYENDHFFYVEDGIVDSIRPVAWPSSDYALSTILNAYGQPDEVWFRSSQFPRNGSLPTIVSLYYSQYGFLLEYWGNGSREGDFVHRCVEDEPVLHLLTWSPEKEWPFTEIKEEFEGPESVQYYLSLEESTGMTVAEFYDRFKKSEDVTCLTSPAELWPGW